MKALSSAIFMIILLIILLSVLIPAFLILNSTPIYSSQGQIAGTAYQQLQQQQQNQIFRGNPNIYYNSSQNPFIQFYYNSLIQPFNISQIYYFNGSTWVPTLNNSIVVFGNQKIPLPKQAFNNPILIISSEANFYFLNPNTSVTTVTISGPAGKVPIYVTAFVLNGSKVIPISIQVVLATLTSNTPQIFYLNPGTYSIADKNSSTIFLPGYGLTAVFQNWTIVGYGNLNSPASLSTSFTVSGPLVLTAIYKAYTQKFTVTINTNGIPLGVGTTVSGSVTLSHGNRNSGGNIKYTLTSLNSTIPVIIDNKTYQVGKGGIQLNLTYGYHIIQFPSYYNITFNYTSPGGYFSKPLLGGQITCYRYTGLSSSTNKISVVGTYEVFVNGSGNITGNYNVFQNYYLVIAENYFYFPNGVWAVKNSTPVNISIAGQLLQVQIMGTNQQIVLGNIKNYVPEKIYFKQGTELQIVNDYSLALYGNFTIYIYTKHQGGNTVQYVGLHSCPINVTVYDSTSSRSVYTYYLNYGTLYINSPMIIVNYQEWEYGGSTSQNGG
ncbi:hypothetical protein V6M85_09320 [Sulfolobus tengchongensis]|uniref:Uncharacterized protein n=1 Tax=Sulfolobus tengchongensis TaxID=207809 RepID=A0AAX4KZT0_9CREN